jgi:hypothetical protein
MFIYEYTILSDSEIAKHLLEVEERPNSYKVIKRHNSYGRRSIYKKSEEGTLLDGYNASLAIDGSIKVLFLKDADDERARQILIDDVMTKISNLKSQLIALEDNLKHIKMANVVENIVTI